MGTVIFRIVPEKQKIFIVGKALVQSGLQCAGKNFLVKFFRFSYHTGLLFVHKCPSHAVVVPDPGILPIDTCRNFRSTRHPEVRTPGLTGDKYDFKPYRYRENPEPSRGSLTLLHLFSQESRHIHVIFILSDDASL